MCRVPRTYMHNVHINIYNMGFGCIKSASNTIALFSTPITYSRGRPI